MLRQSRGVGAGLLVLAATCLVAGQPSQPVFRTGVDLVQLDVRVVDANGQFVRDLRQDEFRIFEDDVEQPLSTFSLIELPLGVSTTLSVAGRRVESDVASNDDPANGRLYVIVMDDRAIRDGPQDYAFRSPTFRAIAREFIERHLTDADRAAVVATSGRTDLATEFTANRQLLLNAVNRFEAGYGQAPFSSGPDGSTFDTDHFARQSVKDVAEWLEQIQGRRKGIVLISEDFGVPSDDVFAQGGAAAIAEALRDIQELIAAAARSNVALYILDPVGRPGSPTSGIKPVFVDDGADRNFTRQVQMEDLAAMTGGFALANSNDYTSAMDRIVVEMSSYYLLGYSSSNKQTDGRLRKLRVEVTRQGLTVRARSGYIAEKPRREPEPRRVAGVPPALTELIKSPLPVPGLSMHVSAAAYYDRVALPWVSVMVEARGRDLQFVERAGRLHGSVAMMMTLTDLRERSIAERGELTLQLSPATHAAVAADGVRLVQRFKIPRGQYQLKVAAVDVGGGKERGSVLYDLTVPDFSKGPLSMSNIVFGSDEASRAPTTGSDQTWQKQLGMPPTTRREFHVTDTVRHYVEIYDNKRRPDHQIVVTSAVQRESGEIVFAQPTTLAQPQKGFRDTRTLVSTLPLKQLGPGRYVLTVEAKSSLEPKQPVSRQVPFSVR